ncbi:MULTISPECIES: TetR/AcrR family transcriptional regulator [Microbacterium]|uniref:DNA-binding transcriptional regulator, AcrR family n=1 Tax=Microbacterium saccharophilum TaxID=1213358 RepID=A0A7Z7CZL9_9MICO|nr:MULTISPECIES: TetR/AcrR family transcriptional regulator [Microbacterium]SFI48983.1 DNA-binding transcriptional regulator, AcrR family [Microbacterium saccharophilum]
MGRQLIPRSTPPVSAPTGRGPAVSPPARAARKGDTRDRLLAAARAVFAERGFPAATVDDIVTQAGSTRATFYMHFSSKAELLGEIVGTIEEYFILIDGTALEDAVRVGDPDRLRAWIDDKLDHWTAIRPALGMLVHADSDPEVAQSVETSHDKVIAQLRRALDSADRFAPGERLARSTVAFGALQHLSRRYASDGWAGRLDRAGAVEALAANWAALLLDRRP